MSAEQELGALLRELVAADRRAAVLCAAQCARSAPRPPPARAASQDVLDAVEAWARGERSGAACRELAGRVGARHRDACTAHALEGVVDGELHDEAAVETAVQAVVQTVSFAVGAATDSAVSKGAIWEQAREAFWASALAIVRAARWPATIPPPERIHGAPEALQVAWDALEALDDLSIPELLAACARAERLGLDWRDPVARAIAERADDEARVRRLLARGAPG